MANAVLSVCNFKLSPLSINGDQYYNKHIDNQRKGSDRVECTRRYMIQFKNAPPKNFPRSGHRN